MNILILSYSDHGGAGSYVLDFHKNLLGMNQNVTMLCLHKITNTDKVIQYSKNKLKVKINKTYDLIENTLEIYKPEYEFHDRGRFVIENYNQIKDLMNIEKFDVLIVGWISKFISYDVIEQIYDKHSLKIYWLLLDMAPLTGGCHFPISCQKFKDSCNNCDAVNFDIFSSNKAFNNLKRKQDLIRKTNPTILYITNWIEEIISSSPIFKDQKKLFIQGNLESSNFYFRNKEEARRVLKLPNDKKIILAGATDIKNKRKGYNNLLNAINIYNKEYTNDFYILTIGENSIKFDKSIKHIHLGFIKDKLNLAMAFSCADLFLSSVLDDLGPTMLLYACLAEVPCVSFNVALAKDIIDHKNGGYIADYMDDKDLAKGIDYILSLSKDEYDATRANSRKKVTELYSDDIQHKQYQLLINDFKHIHE